jgi:hypothetical protein
MTKLVSFRWKKDFIDQEWYKEHPADKYLDWESKAGMMELYILGEEDDLDSEAELYIHEYNNTN